MAPIRDYTDEACYRSDKVESFQGYIKMLGRVDGFDQDQAACKRHERCVILCGLLASHGDALEALQLAESLLDASAALV
jgi:hypothetical protein